MASSPKGLKPAERVAIQQQDVWSIINEAAAESLIQPIANMGQGFFDYNPPDFAINAAKDALDRVDCNQYAPTKGRSSLRKSIAREYSLSLHRELDPDTEVTVTTGANEGILCALMAFISPGDEVILFEPFFDQYISNIEMAGGVIRYVPLSAPQENTLRTSSAEWTVDFKKLNDSFNESTKMIIINSPHNPVGKIFSRPELETIASLCIKHDVLILSDEVYDRLCYVPFTRTATLSEDIFSHTLTVGSAGKAFQATGWRIGYLVGPDHLIKYVAAAHTRICYSSVSPLQEAVAVAFDKANQVGFWDYSQREMKRKLDMFIQVFDELKIPYSYPEGGYFVLANMASIKLPEDYPFPLHISSRPRDFKIAYFLIRELGVAAIPVSEFYKEQSTVAATNYLRFAVCKTDEVLEQAKAKLQQVKKYIV
ncbi:aminotransferase class I and II domain-containing protein [Trichoderma breve]|uniref:Aminotransferase class I and II domain-containing protein n=1 Tax=Trichoderma breve TaxID=2034170 RepID=A0A9W9B3F1_9HYPO|nr:aminotransferase class I and II domain-containing protein [Trichoderma breve]KAJ4854624.1 aminotransferase class I and II domain-containing protein [Trichoderma breve]